MSDLTGKFGAVGDQLTTQHEEIMNALDTIATALGAPPPGPTTTLEDVVTALTQTNTILNGIRSDMNGYLGDIFNTLDTLNNNASLNAQRMLTLMLQTACPCDDTVPLLPPPLSTDPTVLDGIAQCQRIQYFLDVWRSWVISVGVYLNDHGSVSSFQVQNLLDITMADVGITGTELNMMSTSTRDNLSLFLNTVGTPSAINAALFTALNETTLMDEMRQALYAADNATDGVNAAQAAIAASGVAYPGLLAAFFYSSWGNVIYSETPEVDASAYDGSICSTVGPENCNTLTSDWDTVGGATRQAIIWPEGYSAGYDQPNGYSHSELVVLLGDYSGFRVRVATSEAVRILGFSGAGLPLNSQIYPSAEGVFFTIEVSTSHVLIDSYGSSDSPFTIEFCPPA